jgi:hypothetical protein
VLISTKNLNGLSNETLNLDSGMTEKNLKELILLITRRCFSDQWGFLAATYSHINVRTGADGGQYHRLQLSDCDRCN